MLAICRKELKTLFSCCSGYVLVALLFLLVGGCVSICNLMAGSADVAFALFPMQWGLAVAIPFLVARAFGRERERGTDLVLASLPLSHTEVVLGKYLAQVTVLAMPMVLSALLVLLLSALGSPSLSASFASLLGFFLFACALDAICFFASAFAKNTRQALLITLSVSLGARLLDVLAALLPPASPIAVLLRDLSPFSRFEGFSYGYFDLPALVYFVTVISLCLLLTVRIKKPASSRRTVALFAAVAMLATVGCNLLTGLIPYNTAHPSVTGSDTFAISGVSRDELRTLNEDVTLFLIREDGQKSGELYGFLLGYAEENDHIRVDVLDLEEATLRLALHGMSDPPTDGSVLVESARRCRLVDYTDLFFYYCYDEYYGYGITLSPAEYQAELEALASESSSNLAAFIHATTPYFDGDAQMMSAIRYVTLADPLTLCVLTKSVGGSALDTELKQLLTQACCEVKPLLSVVDLPEDCDVLLIHAPSNDLSAGEAEALSAYLANGGKLVLTTFYSYTKLPRLHAILATYGLSYANDQSFVVEGDASYTFSGSVESYPELFYAHVDSTHAATADFDGNFLFYLAHAIEVTPLDGVLQDVWLYSSKEGHLATYNESTKQPDIGEEAAQRPLGVFASRGDSTVLWLSSPATIASVYNSYAEGANYQLFFSALSYLGQQSLTRLNVSARAVDTARLSFSNVSEPLAWSLLVCVLPPACLLAVGSLVCSLRKKRR